MKTTKLYTTINEFKNNVINENINISPEKTIRKYYPGVECIQTNKQKDLKDGSTKFSMYEVKYKGKTLGKGNTEKMAWENAFNNILAKTFNKY